MGGSSVTSQDQNLKIVLQDTDSYYTLQPMDSFRVESGCALVYIVPWEDGKPGRKLILCEVEAGRMIPAFCWQDPDYRKWSFCLLAKDRCELVRKPDSVTNVLRTRFAKYAALHSYQEEGFEWSLVEFYRRELLKDDIYINRGQKAEPEVVQASHSVIRQVFRNQQADSGTGNRTPYLTIAYACKKTGIPLPSEEEIEARCGKGVSAPEIAHTFHFVCRSVVLEPDWTQCDCGTIIGTLDDQTVACVRMGKRGYEIFYGKENRSEPLREEVAKKISPEAYVIGRALPGGKRTIRDIIRFCAGSIERRDLGRAFLLGLVCALIGVLLPTLTQQIYDNYIPMGNIRPLIELCAVIGAFMIGNLFFSIVKNLSGFRICSHVGYDLQNAAYYRIFHLPERFFRSYDSADLAERLNSIRSVASSFANAAVIAGLTTPFSLLYFIRMLQYSGALSGIMLLMYLLYFAFLSIVTLHSIRYEAQIESHNGEARARLYQYLNGVDKIRMAGTEERAILSYLQPFAEGQKVAVQKGRWNVFGETIANALFATIPLVLYVIIVKGQLSISVGTFMAFNTASGAFSSSLQELFHEGLSLYQQKEKVKRFLPILCTSTEDGGNKELPGALTGSVSVEHVTFSYQESEKKVLNDISLNVRAGEYVGIVGASGGGKSTLLKLLLGFETPDVGSILYDGRDLKNLDKSQLRKQLGVVLQNGGLIAGSIYDNITITAPKASMSDVDRVIDAVGLREDINQMPMGIHTMLSENCSTISGGQKQRILIARAIINRPAVLIFDEATSALDNLTQAAVCKSLDEMHITRIVVAHRLSTIRTCDRIFVLDNGKIAEEGSYDALMERKELFYQLASRQIAE